MMKFSDTHDYGMWDAAYVLGSLSSDERREYEAHLATCPACRDAVSELSGMPALLGRLDADEVAAIDDGAAIDSIGDGATAAAVSPPPEMLPTLLAKVSWRRRRTRLLTWSAGAVAAAVLAIGVFVATGSNPVHAPAPPVQAQAAGMTMMRVKPSGITATVSLTSHAWGTRIDMNCTYAETAESSGPATGDNNAGDKLAMVVVERDGSHTQLATWVGLTGVPANPGGSTSTPMDQIAAVQIVSADSGEVLLQRTL
jgi:anti-sigma factor RsiW